MLNSFEEWKRKATGIETPRENPDDLDHTLVLMTAPQFNHDFQRMYMFLIKTLEEMSKERRESMCARQLKI
ncbi:MAG: hypothetical protein E7104_02775 [Prevotella sp.]|nr:hypothetical protein [Prevotella sp.]